MARRKTPPAPPPPTPARVESALHAGHFAEALRLSADLHTITPTADTLTLRKRALAAAAEHFAAGNQFADFNRVMADADALDPADPDWAARRAVMLVGGGRLADALARADALPDPAARLKILGHAADRAMKLRAKDSLPADLHAGFDAVTLAFQKYEAGDDEAARAALQPVGLQSPFLEWKVLLRGLAAYSAGDDARAAENWARLDPARLPARLAAPLRVAVDPGYKESLTADAAGPLAARLQRLTAGPVVAGLKSIQAELGRDKPLAGAFRHAEAVAGRLKAEAPHLLPRLANCFYHAIVAHGHPDDLNRYRRAFGAPADDPHFDKLQAIVLEQAGGRPEAHKHWQKFDAWLAANPPGWPPALVPRARAEVWDRLAANAHRAAAEAEDDEFDDGFFDPPPRRRRKKPPPLSPSAEDCLRRAAEFAPDWPDPARRLFDLLRAAEKNADAEAVARGLLARKPDDLPTLEALAMLVQTQGRAADAAELWRRALAVHPLDKRLRGMTAFALSAVVRRNIIDGDFPGAAAALERERAALEGELPGLYFPLAAVLAAKAGKADEAADLRAKGLAVRGARLGVAYRLMVDSALAKLKPADKRAADKLFAEELAKPPTPLEANQLVAAYDAYHIDGVTYRGQKTHEKKVLDHAQKAVPADAPEEDFERLCELLVLKREWKRVLKLAKPLADRFPRNPYFVVAHAEAMAETNARPYYVSGRVEHAKRLMDAATEPRHKALADRIEELRREFASPFDFLGDFFGRE